MRPLRIDFPGARHHVMNRGARRAPVFFDDECRRTFLALLANFPKRFGVEVHGYALMPNHYHLMLRSVDGNLSRAMRHLGGEYTRRINIDHDWDGPLFRGRFHNRLVQTDAYWRHLLVYLHLNPVRAKLTDLQDSCWTSHAAYLDQESRPPWLVTQELSDLFGDEFHDAHQRCIDGITPPTHVFDPSSLWGPHASAVLPRPKSSRAALHEAVDDICAITELTRGQILQPPSGRRTNPANWLTAWWLSRECGIDHGAICELLNTSHTSVTRKIRYVETRVERDPVLNKWASALRERAAHR